MRAWLSLTAASWYSYLDRGTGPTTNKALFGAAASCRAPLRFMADRLYLFSFATGADLTMIKHFMDHYVRLGVAPSRMHFFVSGEDPEPVLHHLHSQGAIRSRTVPHRYNDSYRLSIVNQFLHELPHHAWILTPDVDELYHYPCRALPKLVNARKDLFCGVMEDMLATSGGIEELRAHPDIHAQYPHRCRVRSFLRRFNVYKIVLARVRPESLGGRPRQFRSVHAFTTTNATKTSRDCHAPNRPLSGVSTRVNVGPLSHYSLTRQQVIHAMKKAARHEQNYNARMRMKEDNEWTSCGTFARDNSTPTRRCVDYERILQAMSLIYNYSRGDAVRIARLCHVPANIARPAASSTATWNALIDSLVKDGLRSPALHTDRPGIT